MKNNNKSAITPSPQPDEQPIAVQIETDPTRIEELIQAAQTSPKPMNSFLAEELHYGAITPQELIDTLRYFSLTPQTQPVHPEPMYGTKREARSKN